MTDINKLSTKDLVARYNELTGKTIKKFSSRSAGEKQVAALIKKLSPSTAQKAPAKPKAPKTDKPVDADRSAAIAKSWEDPAVAAKRAERNSVKAGNKVYRSVKQAFEDLGLPLQKHIKFRMELKSVGTMTFKHEGRAITFHVEQE